jgi:hypothetical protein
MSLCALVSEKLPQFEIIMGADNRSTRHARKRLHMPQHVEFGQARQHANVKQGSAEAAAGEGKPYPANKRGSNARFIATQEILDNRPRRRCLHRSRVPLNGSMQPRNASELARGTLVFPILYDAARFSLLQPVGRLVVPRQSKECLSHRGLKPPPST